MIKNNPKIEKFRYTQKGPFSSNSSFGNNGMFHIKIKSALLRMIVSDQMGWDHVSVSLEYRTPTWEEMCIIKDLFFYPEEIAVQIHPPKSQYINICEYCLHIWRDHNNQICLPPKIMIG